MVRITCGLVLALALSGAAPEGRALELSEGIQGFNQHARFPLPVPNDAQLGRLAEGKVVRIRVVSEDPDEPQSVVGLIFAEQTRDRLWLGAMDPHFVAADEIKEVRISADGVWPTRWYQYLELPWPFQGRHWVIDVMNNHDLAATTQGRHWEHWWDLVEGGPAISVAVLAEGRAPAVDPDDAAEAIYTPVNRGAWVTISLPSGGTLLAYHVTTVVGGRIPDKAVADYSLFLMKKVLLGVLQRAEESVPGHYDAAHEPLAGGDGAGIAPVER